MATTALLLLASAPVHAEPPKGCWDAPVVVSQAEGKPADLPLILRLFFSGKAGDEDDLFLTPNGAGDMYIASLACDESSCDIIDEGDLITSSGKRSNFTYAPANKDIVVSMTGSLRVAPGTGDFTIDPDAAGKATSLTLKHVKTATCNRFMRDVAKAAGN